METREATETVVPLEENDAVSADIFRGTAFEEFERSRVHQWIKEWLRGECQAYLDEMRESKAEQSADTLARLMMRWVVAEDIANAYEDMVAGEIRKKEAATTMLKEKLIEYSTEY